MPIPRNSMPRATNKESSLHLFSIVFDRRRLLRRFFLRKSGKKAEKSCGLRRGMDYYR